MRGLPYTLSTPQCILHWVHRTPDAIAVIEGARHYTYGDLGVGIAQYVKALRATGLRPDMLMGVACANRYCQSALNSFQVTAPKSFHLIRPVSTAFCVV